MQTPQQTVTYGYDKQGNLTTITQGSEVTTIAYDENNRRNSLTYPNGIKATYTYDDTGRLTAIAYTKNTTVIDKMTYTYDANGNIIQRTRTSAGSQQETQKNATYDPGTNRLLSHTDAQGNTQTYTTTTATPLPAPTPAAPPPTPGTAAIASKPSTATNPIAPP